MKVLVVFYSMYGHVYRLAEAIAEGAKEVKGAEVEMRRVPETLSEEILGKMGAIQPQKAFAHIPIWIAGSKGGRMPSQNELAAARFQGGHVAAIAFKLTK